MAKTSARQACAAWSLMRFFGSCSRKIAEVMGERRIIAQFSTCGCAEVRQLQRHCGVRCAGRMHQMSTERTEAEETAIYTEKCGVSSSPNTLKR